MGDVSRVLITGASGFIGQRTVAEARARGLDVVAVVRRKAPKTWEDDGGITLLRCDLAASETAALADAMQGVDAVIHAAAHLGGDAAAHASDSVRATQSVLTAMQGTGVQRLVLVSSIAVYDTMQVPIGSRLTEDCLLEAVATARDAYVRGKLMQEEMCAATARAQGVDLWRMRPGAVFGPNRLSNAHLGLRAGPVLIRLGGKGQVPLCHVDRCAWVLVQAAVTPGGGALNVLDDDLPDRTRFVAALRRSGWPRVVIPLPWQGMLALARMLNRPGLPGLLREPVLRARITPLSYSNRAMRRTLGGQQVRPFEALMTRAIAQSDP